jgi:hypothetical protein
VLSSEMPADGITLLTFEISANLTLCAAHYDISRLFIRKPAADTVCRNRLSNSGPSITWVTHIEYICNMQKYIDGILKTRYGDGNR